MRKLFTFCLLAISGVSSIQAQQVALKGGVKFSTIHSNYSNEGIKSNTGLMLGLDLTYPMKKNFLFTAGFLFNQKGTATENTRTRLYFADIPFKFGYNREIFYNVFMTLNVGGYFGVGLFGKQVSTVGEKTSSNIKWGNETTLQEPKNFRRLDYGALAEAKFIFNEQFGFNFGYELGLADMLPKNELITTNLHGYNRSFYIGLIYIIKQK